MQECCKAAPRRARYVVIAIVVLGAIALAVMERRNEVAAAAPTGETSR